MKAVVGIGNPGREYTGTRHNVGFDVLDVLAGRNNLSWSPGFGGRLCSFAFEGGELVLHKPSTYVNNSGGSVASLIKHYGLSLDDLLVVVDDFNLALGRLRLKRAGTSGGHKGLSSIIGILGDGFCRLRIGIGDPKGDAVNFVLSRFSPKEREIIDIVVQTAADAVIDWFGKGIDFTSERYNGLSFSER